jgi:hypothetical protein
MLNGPAPVETPGPPAPVCSLAMRDPTDERRPRLVSQTFTPGSRRIQIPMRSVASFGMAVRLRETVLRTVAT